MNLEDTEDDEIRRPSETLSSEAEAKVVEAFQVELGTFY